MPSALDKALVIASLWHRSPFERSRKFIVKIPLFGVPGFSIKGALISYVVTARDGGGGGQAQKCAKCADVSDPYITLYRVPRGYIGASSKAILSVKLEIFFVEKHFRSYHKAAKCTRMGPKTPVPGSKK